MFEHKIMFTYSLRWEQFFSNLLNANQSTSHEGSKVYPSEPDIPEPSLIEVEPAIGKLKRLKATGVIIFHPN